MSTNLVASAAKLLTPELLSRFASAFGIDQTMLEKAVNAGIPGLLAAFTSMVSRPGGATKLADAVARQQPGVLTNLSTAGPAGQRDIIDNGLGSLSSLFGSGTLSTLAQALSRYAGIGDAGSKGVLGLLGPLLLGVLGQQQRGGSGPDAAGLTQLLQSQSANIARALPSGFARQLSDAGIIEQMPSASSAGRMRDRPAGEWNWVMPALAVLALGALAWYLFGRPHEQNVATAPSAVETPMQSPRDIVVTAMEEKNWVGRPMLSRDNQKVGEVIEIKRGPDDKLTDIYFDAGTFLGMGAKRYHVTADQIEEVKPNGVVMKLDETEVKQLPEAGGATQ